MKHPDDDDIANAVKVAPRAGAWIETASFLPPIPLICVAPRAGAWIETIFSFELMAV
ncbi:MAG: hypothetical protein WC701_09645 [Kiritimatiellales bacterium]